MSWLECKPPLSVSYFTDRDLSESVVRRTRRAPGMQRESASVAALPPSAAFPFENSRDSSRQSSLPVAFHPGPRPGDPAQTVLQCQGLAINGLRSCRVSAAWDGPKSQWCLYNVPARYPRSPPASTAANRCGRLLVRALPMDNGRTSARVRTESGSPIGRVGVAGV